MQANNPGSNKGSFVTYLSSTLQIEILFTIIYLSCITMAMSDLRCIFCFLIINKPDRVEGVVDTGVVLS